MNWAIVSLLSAIFSVVSIVVVFAIFKKVYQEDYKRPWLFIAISSIVFALGQILRFFNGFYLVQIGNQPTTEFVLYVLDFITVVILFYGLLLEFLILRYIKGKFVKVKFIPVQEGTLGGELDINVSIDNGYIAFQKDRKFLFEQFYQATHKGFEGFLITEENPKSIRTTYKIEKTPIAWISQIQSQNSEYVHESLDQNSDIIDPLQLNNLISFIENFLEQSSQPFILLELNQILRLNNHVMTFEFLRYITEKMKKHHGIFICTVNIDVLEKSEMNELRVFLKELE